MSTQSTQAKVWREERVHAALDFLRLLYGPEPFPGHFVLWTKQDRRSTWFSGLRLDDMAAAAADLAGHHDVYFGVGVQQAQLGAKERGTAATVCAIPGLWADVDVRGPAHKADNLPPTTQAAIELLGDFPLEPTVIVETGGGLHAWWLFPELWRFSSGEEREQAARLSERFQATLAALARKRGWHLDSTHDLARVLRLPGTANRKPELPHVEAVRVRAVAAGRRYQPDEFELHLIAPTTSWAPAPPVGEAIPDGQRNATLTSLAGSMRRRGMGEEAIFAGLQAENQAKCSPPLPDEEIRTIARSISRRPRGAQTLSSSNSFSSSAENAAIVWPALDPAARHGIAGEVVRVLEPHTEADPVALLLTFLTATGNIIGRRPHAIAEAEEHPGRLFADLVGKTSKARKGSAWAQVRKVLAVAVPAWLGANVVSGLASGEALVHEVRDGDDDGVSEVGDPGVADKRRLIRESEFARLLTIAGREGNTLSANLRDAWDGQRLENRTKRSLRTATDAHISIVGHVTVEELRRTLTSTEIANGFANRFLFALVRRTGLLPEGGNLDPAALDHLAVKVQVALERAAGVGLLRRTPEARELWAEAYEGFGDGEDGLAGAVTARAEAQALRLSVLYAALDGATEIDVQHLEAALAVWRYCETSAHVIFGDATGDPVADRLLEEIRKAGAEGLDGTAQHKVFGRNVSANRLDLARQMLERGGLIVTTSEPTAGRSRLVSRAIDLTKKTN